MSNRVVHFEIQADDPERAVGFYTDIFGWEMIKWGGMAWQGYYLDTEGNTFGIHQPDPSAV